MMRRIAAPAALKRRALPASDGDDVRGSRLPLSNSLLLTGPKPCQDGRGSELSVRSQAALRGRKVPGRANVSAAAHARSMQPGLLDSISIQNEA